MEEEREDFSLEIEKSYVAEEVAETNADGGAVQAEGYIPPDAPLTREEILKASRKENRNGDERDVQIYNKAMQLGYGIGMIIFAIIIIVETIVWDRIPAEFWVVYSTVMATQGLYYGIKSNRKRGLFLAEGVLGVVCFIIFTTLWILQLCGVA